MAKGAAEITTDHEFIRNWVEQRGGRPATVEGTAGKNEKAGLLRFNFPGYAEQNLKNISWDDFFRKFEEEQLAFLYQEKSAAGKPSRFVKLVRRDD